MEFISALKSLEIELQTEFTFSDEQLPSGLFFLSKVTALVALRQMPHLDFQVKIRPEHAKRECKFYLCFARINYIIIQKPHETVTRLVER